MRTRSQTRNRNRQQQAPPAVVESFNLEEPFDNPPLVPMADNRTMAELLQAPTEGYEDAICLNEDYEEEQNQPGVIQELLLKLMNDLQSLKGSQQEKKETTAQSFTPYWDVSMIDDEEA
ncbi:hypothetical protein Tco_0540788 [Tanacetum coccineum]